MMKLAREKRLLSFREQQEKLAELDTALAANRVAIAEQTIAGEQQSIEHLSQRIMKGSQATAFAHMSQTSMALRLRLQQFKQQLTERQASLEESNRQLVEARQRAESLRLLIAKKNEAYESDAERRNQAETDAMTMNKWTKRPRQFND